MPSAQPSAAARNVPSAAPDTAPRQPWLHELVLAVHGNATALSDRAGAMGDPGTGLFVDDRRVVSLLDVWLGEHPTCPVVARARGNEAQFWGSARHLGAEGADPTVEVHRERVVRDGGMTEIVTVRSRTTVPVQTTLTVVIGGDGAPLSTVKSGRPGPELVPALRMPAAPASAAPGDGPAACLSWSDERHTTRVSMTPAPVGVRAGHAGEASVLTLPVDVTPGTPLVVELHVDTRRVAASNLDADAAAHRSDWAGARVVSDDDRLGQMVEHSMTDLAHLLLDDPEDREDFFAAAGSPWYLTLFGRDSLWAARLALPFSISLAGGTLRTLARRQGRVANRATAEEPGKILHEVRRELFVDDSARLDLPPVYYGTVDATALWVCLLHDAWRRGLPADEVRALLPNLEAAMGWLQRRCASSTDGFLRYVDETGKGLANQGWKDSGDSMRRADGSIAPAPIALVEAQAYAVEAAHGAAALGEAFGLDAAGGWRVFGEALSAAVRAAFWTGSAGARGLAMAIDGSGDLVDGIGSNMGHVLGTGALTHDEAEQVTSTLVSSNMLGPHGISTLSRSNPAYNPIGYHTGSVWTHDTAVCAVGMAREGFADEAARVAHALVEAGAELGFRMPELYSGDPVLGAPAPYPASCRPQAWSAASAAGIVTALLGLDVDVPSGVVRLNPSATAPFGALRVEGLAYGAERFTVEVDRAGQVRVEGLPDGVHVQVGR